MNEVLENFWNICRNVAFENFPNQGSQIQLSNNKNLNQSVGWISERPLST